MKLIHITKAQENQNFFDSIDPLKIIPQYDPESVDKSEQFSTIGGFINELLKYILPFSFLILLIMLVWGGFDILTGAMNRQNVEKGKRKITYAIFGFILLFASYWIIQIIEYIFNISILN